MKRTLSAIFPNGCSGKQREELRDSWFKKYGNPYLNSGKWSKTIWKLDAELDGLSMLQSCFAYGGVETFYQQREYCGKGSYYEHSLARFIDKGGTQKEFDKMISLQLKHYNNAKVCYAGIDGEGISYNAVQEKDEPTVL